MKGVTNGATLFQKMLDAGYTPVKPKAPTKRTKAPTKSAADILASIRRQTMPKKKKPVDPAKKWSGVPYVLRRLRDEYSATTVEDIMAAWGERYAPSLNDPPPQEMLLAEAEAAIEELAQRDAGGGTSA